MPFYETVFETGEVSVAEYADEAEAMSALKAQNDRAKIGGLNGPQGGPATRVAACYPYPDGHPGSLNEAGGLSADVLLTGVTELIANMKDKNGVVHVMSFSNAVQGLVHPMHDPETPHGSRFKMESGPALDLSELA